MSTYDIYRLFFVTLNEIGGKSTWEKLAISCTHSASLISVNSNFWRKFRTKITNISQYLAKKCIHSCFFPHTLVHISYYDLWAGNCHDIINANAKLGNQ